MMNIIISLKTSLGVFLFRIDFPGAVLFNECVVKDYRCCRAAVADDVVDCAGACCIIDLRHLALRHLNPIKVGGKLRFGLLTPLATGELIICALIILTHQ